MPGVSSVQITFHEDADREHHAMPPGGFRLAIVNALTLEAGQVAREKLRRVPGAMMPCAAGMTARFRAARSYSASCMGKSAEYARVLSTEARNLLNRSPRRPIAPRPAPAGPRRSA